MPTTMKDIATLAGVSVGTVDRALNNRGRINPSVKQRICAIAEQMNYERNTLAKSLAMYKKNQTIAIVLHVQQNDFFSRVIDGVHHAAREVQDFGIEVKTYGCDDFNAAMQLRQIEAALSDGATGLVIVPIDHPDIRAKLQSLNEEGFPVVFLSALLQDVPCLCAVHCDYPRSGRIGGSLLRMITGGKGCAMAFSPSFSMMGHRLRLENFATYLVDTCPDLRLVKIVELPNDALDDYRITREELAAYPDVDCVLFCGNTKSGLKAIAECGRPIKSVFYDFLPGTQEALLEGKIDAAIFQGPEEQGYRSIMILHEYFTRDKRPDREIVIQNEIVLKECIDVIPPAATPDLPPL